MKNMAKFLASVTLPYIYKHAFYKTFFNSSLWAPNVKHADATKSCKVVEFCKK